MKTWFYVKIFMKYFLLLSLAALTAYSRLFLLILSVSLLVYFLRLRPRYRWNSIPFIYAISSFGTIIVKEWSLWSGWIAGIMRKSSGASR